MKIKKKTRENSLKKWKFKKQNPKKCLIKRIIKNETSKKKLEKKNQK